MKKITLYGSLVVCCVLLLASAVSQIAAKSWSPPSADLVLTNGNIATMDDELARAQAIAIQDERIEAVGSTEEIHAYIGPSTRVIDLEGRFTMPGFIEGHGHLLQLGRSKMALDLSKAKGWDEIVSMVQEAASKAQPGEWILGSGWHQDKWTTRPFPNVEGYPLHESLSRASPDNPVYLTHASGHAGFANAKAMEMAGISTVTPDPPGGRIIRGATGNPIGVFLESAQGLILAVRDRDETQRPSNHREAQERKAIDLAIEEALSKGVTSFQDAGSSFRTIDLFRKMADEGALGIRLWVMIREDNASLVRHIDRYKMLNAGNHRLTVRSIKRFMDGALGSRSAWLLEPYSDLVSSTGLNVEPMADIMETARIAAAHGLQLCVHAIGDRANRETLNIFETVFKETPGEGGLRWRIEHAQHISGQDISRFGRLGVIASMQPIHAISDAPWVVSRLGEIRAEEGAYVWRKLIESGATVNVGTDAPVEAIDPIANFHAAVTRRLPDGSEFYAKQRMSREEALHAYTLNNAYAAFEEDLKGSITPGKLADITVLSQDILSVSEDKILDTQVVYTIVGGKIMYRNEENLP